jgi:Zn-dependent protease with chaperone function
MYEEISTRPSAGGGGRGTSAVAWSFAGLVHLLTVVLVATAVWLIVGFHGLPIQVRVVAAVLIGGLACYVQPFRRRRRPSRPNLRRASAPELFRLIDDVAAAMGAPTIEAVEFDEAFNASYFKLRRRRPAIRLGLMLWTVLEPQERVALLGHELGHRVNGDLRSTAFVGRALRSLAFWLTVFQPAPTMTHGRGPRRGVGLEQLAELLLPFVLLPFELIVLSFGNGLSLVANRRGQQSEYYADELACIPAGSAATARMLEKLLIGDSCWQALGHTVRFQRDADVWQAVRDFAESVPELEWERRSRLAMRKLQRIDISHPPTMFRVNMVRQRPARAPKVVLNTDRAEMIQAELAAVASAIARGLR